MITQQMEVWLTLGSRGSVSLVRGGLAILSAACAFDSAEVDLRLQPALDRGLGYAEAFGMVK